MKLTLTGHDDLYAVEQLQMTLFPQAAEGTAVSRLSRGKTWLTATATIKKNKKIQKNRKNILTKGGRM